MEMQNGNQNIESTENKNKINERLTGHYDQLTIENTYLLVGESIEEPIEVSGGLITYSEIIKDHFSNLVVVKDLPRLDFEYLENFYKEKGLPLALAINENKLSSNDKESLEKKGFKVKNKSAYMVYEGTELNSNDKVQIQEATTETKRNDYLEILRKVFCEGEGVYGGLSTEYLDATERYFKVYPQDRRLDYIAYYEGSPVGTTSFLFNDNYAVIIAAATLPEFQKKGIAKSMISKGIQKMSGKTIFLVTETKTVNEDIYKRMGFNTKLIEPVYIKEKI